MIDIAYIFASVAAIGAMAPQVRQLLLTKRTDELSLLSWIIWTVAQIISTVYAVSVHAQLYIAISVIWLFYYVGMVGIIFYYRRARQPKIDTQNIAAEHSAQPIPQAN